MKRTLSDIDVVDDGDSGNDVEYEERQSLLLEYLVEPSWKEKLSDEFTKPYFRQLEKFVVEEYSQLKTKLCFPPIHLVFNALNKCELSKVRVVILSQDPYINLNQAMGLAFSVPKTNKVIPPSLKNIFIELKNSLGTSFEIPNHGDLTEWAERGCLLLNTTLTVEAGQSGSHVGQGWEIFTGAVIDTLLKHAFDAGTPLVFMLWGNNSKEMASPRLRKCEVLNHKLYNDLILTLYAAHPSPFSAAKGYFGCRHFALANEWLKNKGQEEFNWSITNHI